MEVKKYDYSRFGEGVKKTPATAYSLIRAGYYSEEDINAFEKACIEKGNEQGRAEITGEKASSHKQITAAVEVIKAKMTALIETYQANKDHRIQEATQLAIVMAKKVAGTALSSLPTDPVREAVKEAFDLLDAAPSFTIQVHPSLCEEVERIISQACQAQHFPGEVVCEAVPTIPPADCRVEWKDGELQRNEQLLWEKIEGLAQQLVANLSQNPNNKSERSPQAPVPEEVTEEKEQAGA